MHKIEYSFLSVSCSYTTIKALPPFPSQCAESWNAALRCGSFLPGIYHDMITPYEKPHTTASVV